MLSSANQQGNDESIHLRVPHQFAALLAVQARGVSPAVPAAALWHEFEAARAALLALAPPANEAARPRRFA